jgi:hypothetical protein
VLKKFGDDNANLLVVSLAWYGFTAIFPGVGKGLGAVIDVKTSVDCHWCCLRAVAARDGRRSTRGRTE